MTLKSKSFSCPKLWTLVKKLTLLLKGLFSVSICDRFRCCCSGICISSIGVCVFGSLVWSCCLRSVLDTAPMEVSREAVQVLS